MSPDRTASSDGLSAGRQGVAGATRVPPRSPRSWSGRGVERMDVCLRFVGVADA